MIAAPCPRCGGDPSPTGWCDTCQRRVAEPPVIRFEERSTSSAPRRWMVKRRFLHTTAALMSLAIPGAGQVYKGRLKAGLAWFLIVATAYLLVGAPGIIVHLMCVVTAGSAARVVRRPFVSGPAGWTRR